MASLQHNDWFISLEVVGDKRSYDTVLSHQELSEISIKPPGRMKGLGGVTSLSMLQAQIALARIFPNEGQNFSVPAQADRCVPPYL